MARISWDEPASHLYETGVDRGVLYVDADPGVPWNGLTSITENVSGGAAKPFYIDGEKYLNLASREEFEATLSAYTYPDEFGVCDGTAAVRPGLFVTGQKRKSFSLTYRTKVGNDQTDEYAYKVHIIYNALADPSSKPHKSLGASIEPENFAWNLTSIPAIVDGYRKSSHIVLDSRLINTKALSQIEDALYGTDASLARLPVFDELAEFVDINGILTVTDNGDGTYTMTAPARYLFLMDASDFQLTWSTAVFIDANTYTVTSSA